MEADEEDDDEWCFDTVEVEVEVDPEMEGSSAFNEQLLDATILDKGALHLPSAWNSTPTGG